MDLAPNTIQKIRPPAVPQSSSKLVQTTPTRSDSSPRAVDSEAQSDRLPDEDIIHPLDPLFVVMGVTGAGKSTFISLLSEDAVEVGHGLQSSKSTSVSISTHLRC
jgi:excinuclease UvrABC ATPase subunit